MAKKLVRKVKKVKRKYKKSKTLKQKQTQKQTVIVNIGKPKAVKKRRKTGKKSLPQLSQSQQGLSTMLIQPQQGVNTSEIKLLVDALRQTQPLGRATETLGRVAEPLGRATDFTEDYISELGDSVETTTLTEVTPRRLRRAGLIPPEVVSDRRFPIPRQERVETAQPAEGLIESRQEPRITFMGRPSQ